jgi:hypothetical protein
MKNQLIGFQVLLFLFIVLWGCGEQPAPKTMGIAATQLFKITVADHQTKQKLRGVEVDLNWAGSSSTVKKTKTNSNGECFIGLDSIKNGSEIRFFVAEFEPVTITVDKRSSLHSIGLEMWKLSTGNNSINGIVNPGTWSGQTKSEYKVVSRIPPYESDSTEMGVYDINVSNQTAPFRIDYLTSKDTVKLTVTRPGGGSATIDVAFDDSGIVIENRN